MATPGATAERTTDGEQHRGSSACSRAADSVKLKLTVPESDRFSAAEALGMDPLDAHVRLVHFFDTPELALLGTASCSAPGGCTATARTRGSRCATSRRARCRVRCGARPRSRSRSPRCPAAPHARRGSRAGRGRATSRASRRASCPCTRCSARSSGTPTARTLPDGPALDDLVALGPVVVLKLKYTPEVLGRRLVGELWHLPGGEQVLELATRCHPEDALARARGDAGLPRAATASRRPGGPEPARRALELLAESPQAACRPAARRGSPATLRRRPRETETRRSTA